MSTGRLIKVSTKRNWIAAALIALSISIGLLYAYVKSNPLVFNESFFGHAHCMPQAGLALRLYAGEHQDLFPSHTNGYGDALLILLAQGYAESYALTGPIYDPAVFDRALANSTDVPEQECGRVYVEGLSPTNNSEIAIIFDKTPTPGGDHCHLISRLTAPLCRDVCFVDGIYRTIRESNWPEFSSNQIQLLVKEGFPRETAEKLYAEKGKVR